MPPLSILHISTYDNYGGSAKSAYKIHTGLRDLGVDSKMLVLRQSTTDPDIAQIAPGWLKGADALIGRGLDAMGLQYVFYPSSFLLYRHPWFRNADVVQFYNTHSGYFSHSALPFMHRGKVLVWRLSDMWPMTGHCAYSGACEKWKTGCRGCPDLATFPSLKIDTAWLLWKWKKWIYSHTKIHVVAPSRWIQDVARESPLFAAFQNSYISNGINTRIFRPIDKAMCRKILGIPEDRKAVLFLANTLSDPKKGGTRFIRAMNILEEKRPGKYQALAVGEKAMTWGKEIQSPLWKHELVRDDELLALIYGAADLYVHAAPRENFPNTILEAMACGVPVVAAASGGVKEAVIHKETGYLISPEDDGSEMAEGIIWGLESDWDRVSANCRAFILSDFSQEKQARSFLDLYNRLTG